MRKASRRRVLEVWCGTLKWAEARHGGRGRNSNWCDSGEHRESGRKGRGSVGLEKGLEGEG
jgi:hypothetical protein